MVLLSTTCTTASYATGQEWKHLLKNTLALSRNKTYQSAQQALLKLGPVQNGALTVKVQLLSVRALQVENWFPDYLMAHWHLSLVTKGIGHYVIKPQKMAITSLVLSIIKLHLDLAVLNDGYYWRLTLLPLLVFYGQQSLQHPHPCYSTSALSKRGYNSWCCYNCS